MWPEKVSNPGTLNFIGLIVSPEMILNIFFVFITFCCHGHQPNCAICINLIGLVEDHSRNIFKETLSKYLQRNSNQCNIFNFADYKSIATLISQSNQTVDSIAMKKNTKFLHWLLDNLEVFGVFLASKGSPFIEHIVQKSLL